MEFEFYQSQARRTQNKDLTLEQKLRHGLYGLAAEVGEVCSIFQKEMQGHDVDSVKIMDECGDVLWMLSEIADACGFSLNAAAFHNIDKLRARYPEGFDSDRSVNRRR